MKKTYLVVVTYYVMLVLAGISAVIGYNLFLKQGISIEDQAVKQGIYTFLLIYTIITLPLALKLYNIGEKRIKAIEDKALKNKRTLQYGIAKVLVIGLGLVINILFFYLLKERSLIYLAGISAIGLYLAKPKKKDFEEDEESSNIQ